MRPIYALACLLVLSAALVAQEQENRPIHTYTTAPTNARFEIVQSTLVVRHTFKLDRYSGHIRQLVKTATDDVAWDAMTVFGLPKTIYTSPTYQIFLSGHLVRHAFLLNTQTGQTWQIQSSTDKDGNTNFAWYPLE